MTMSDINVLVAMTTTQRKVHGQSKGYGRRMDGDGMCGKESVLGTHYNRRSSSTNESIDGFSQPKINDIQSSIVRPAIPANTFEIKPDIIRMVKNSVQFGGSPTKDPNMHIRDFIDICDTFKFNNISEDAIKLRLLPFSLKDKVKSWLHSLPAGSITT
ncbi:hypothetical protein AgCh_004331 [Apium graveolens]